MRTLFTSTLLMLLLVFIAMAAALTRGEQKPPQQQQQQGEPKERREEKPLTSPTISRNRRSMYFAIMQGIGITKEATRWGCRVVRTNFCNKFEKTLGLEQQQQQQRARRSSSSGASSATVMNTADTIMMDNILPRDVDTLLERTTAELRKTAQMDGFYELSELAQERVMLETAAKQSDVVKEKLKAAIDEARKMLERALGTIISYSEVPMESKIAMEQVFATLTDDTKTPQQKVDRIKEIEAKWTPEMRDALKPTTSDKDIKEAANFFTSVPHQIELGTDVKP